MCELQYYLYKILDVNQPPNYNEKYKADPSCTLLRLSSVSSVFTVNESETKPIGAETYRRHNKSGLKPIGEQNLSDTYRLEKTYRRTNPSGWTNLLADKAYIGWTKPNRTRPHLTRLYLTSPTGFSPDRFSLPTGYVRRCDIFADVADFVR